MWIFGVVIVLLLAAVVFGAKEILTFQRRPLIIAVAAALGLSLANNFYGWGMRGDVQVAVALGVVGAIRFFEK